MTKSKSIPDESTGSAAAVAADIIEPLALHYGSDLIEPQEYGGKAASLRRLASMGLSIPPAWVIPCNFSTVFGKKPLKIGLPGEIWEEIETDGAKQSKLFSVRSGAPISMPGMMLTRLNVPPGEIRAGIIAVIESYNSPHAIQYRSDAAIPHDIGTAVIIQEMPEGGVKFAGTAMTAPDNMALKHDFVPDIEAVAGLGDTLVSGASSGKKATAKMLGSVLYNSLLKGLEQLHSKLGASDVEWCISGKEQLYFLQWRPQKFSPPVVEESDKGRTILAIGKPIGARNTVIAELVDLACTKKAQDKIACVGAFQPELYALMMEASALIANTGGSTCHAAIIAKSKGKPAISGISASELAYYLGQKIRLNGATGVISLPLATDISEESAVTTAIHLAPLVPDLNVRGYNWTADSLLCRFYKAIDDLERGELSEERFAVICHELAQIFAAYQYVICACECRYAPSHLMELKGDEPKIIAEAFALVRSLGIPLPKTAGKGGREYFSLNIKQPQSLALAIQALEKVAFIFRTCWKGSTGVGGVKWAQITEHCLGYLRGDIPAMLYVDANFNLQHNGGLYFNKFSWMTPGNIAPLLDAKQKSFGALKASAGALMSHANVKAESLLAFLPAKAIKETKNVEVVDVEIEEAEEEDQTCCSECGCGECECELE